MRIKTSFEIFVMQSKHRTVALLLLAITTSVKAQTNTTTAPTKTTTLSMNPSASIPATTTTNKATTASTTEPVILSSGTGSTIRNTVTAPVTPPAYHQQRTASVINVTLPAALPSVKVVPTIPIVGLPSKVEAAATTFPQLPQMATGTPISISLPSKANILPHAGATGQHNNVAQSITTTNDTVVVKQNTGAVTSVSNTKSSGVVKDPNMGSPDVTAGIAKNMFKSFGDMSDWSNPAKTQSNVWKNFWGDQAGSADESTGKSDAMGWNKIRNGTDGIFNWTIHSDRRLGVPDAQGFVDLGKQLWAEKHDEQELEVLARLITERDALVEEGARLKQWCELIRPQPIAAKTPSFLN